MKGPQFEFFDKPKRDHGGSLAVGTRRGRRPLSTKESVHVILKTDRAIGPRNLRKFLPLIKGLIKRFGERFGITVYKYAVCGNHIHLLLRGTVREGIQNFFRVFAGQIAQTILRNFPLKPDEVHRPTKACKKNQRAFWQYLTYSRVLTWGREFKTVQLYIEQNNLEALNLIAYKPRNPKRRRSRPP